ncbi:hypothetical protein M413DRAFT_447814 [Hebeloma cylindrosporum]|uniref:Uncharacterized protein n=1 Tax=Hebeloma cylindrosporum TaxID=76867 RepID=A0A0C3BNR4_HEBCY|nr:hypothetical protein M413DRAFT_447814 [Hebeloma cylindrosporum h7]
MLLLVSMSQPAHPDPNSSRTFEIIFKLSFMIFNVVAFAQFVGTMRFWGAMGEVHEYWQNELKIPGRREQWAKDIEKCISPQGDAPVLGCSAIPSGPSGPDMAGPTVADSTTACCDEAISQLSAPSEG